MATEALAMNPFDMDLQIWLTNLHNQKQVLENYIARGAQLKARLHLLAIGDQASKEFFNALRACHSVLGIKFIRVCQHTFYELPDILQAFIHHYEIFFIAQGPSVAQTQALQACLVVIPKRLVADQYVFCEQKLTLDDLKEDVFSMADDKAPGCDGFPCEFYKNFWDEIGPDLHKVYIEAYNSHSLGTIINK